MTIQKIKLGKILILAGNNYLAKKLYLPIFIVIILVQKSKKCLPFRNKLECYVRFIKLRNLKRLGFMHIKK